MHRTTTTAVLLVTVAVSALSGCVTVQRPPLSGPQPGPSRASVPRPDGTAQPQIAQSPARESLELTGPSRRPASAAAPLPVHRPPDHAAQPGARPRLTQPRRPGRPRGGLPDVAGTVRKNTDVCALGKKYGGWRPDSPESTACEQAYGR